MPDADVPTFPLPPWTFVGGVTPRHAEGAIEQLLHNLDDTARWHTGRHWLQHGFAFEAHEAWEGLWLHAKARGDVDTARELQMLIRLAAAHVKLRQASLVGAHEHARCVLVLVDSAPTMRTPDVTQPVRALCAWVLALTAPPAATTSASESACLYPRVLVEALQPTRP
jgi:hypothetical protein